jgi:hypothetical protein
MNSCGNQTKYLFTQFPCVLVFASFQKHVRSGSNSRSDKQTRQAKEHWDGGNHTFYPRLWSLRKLGMLHNHNNRIHTGRNPPYANFRRIQHWTIPTERLSGSQLGSANASVGSRKPRACNLVATSKAACSPVQTAPSIYPAYLEQRQLCELRMRGRFATRDVNPLVSHLQRSKVRAREVQISDGRKGVPS